MIIALLTRSALLSRCDLLNAIMMNNDLAAFQIIPMHLVGSWLDNCLSSLLLNHTLESLSNHDGSEEFYRISPINYDLGGLKRQH